MFTVFTNITEFTFLENNQLIKRNINCVDVDDRIPAKRLFGNLDVEK